MEAGAGRGLDARLDQQQYNDDQLILIKVPLSDLAYCTYTSRFERSTGQVDIGGIPYRYVKRRLYNDSLEMYCIPNQAALQVRQRDAGYFQLVTDLNAPQQGSSHPGPHKMFTTDPFICLPDLLVAPVAGDRQFGGASASSLYSRCLPTDERPPAVASFA